MKTLNQINRQNGQKTRSQKAIKREAAENGRKVFDMIHKKK